MKYVIILGDGMSDEPVEELGGKTPLEVAQKPIMDKLAKVSEVGIATTVPEGMNPGSDTANLSVIGYNPKVYYSGRSPLEGLSIGVKMNEEDVTFRCNLVTLSEEESSYGEQKIIDHSAGEITTQEAKELILALKEGLQKDKYQFFQGISYRHLLVWEGGHVLELTPPHDILEKTIGNYLPEDSMLKEMMVESYKILKDHPINKIRKEKGLNPANSAWFWGAGTKPNLPLFEEKTGKKGVMVSAVDLLKGIAVGIGMDNIAVEGANGGLYTNYEGKAKAAVHALLNGGYDFVYIHVEAPDEMGHQGNVADKIRAIEYLDEKVVKKVVEGLESSDEEFRILILPDHPTPVRLRTHTSNPVPYLLYDSTCLVKGTATYSEEMARSTNIEWEEGYKLIDHLFGSAGN